MAVAMCAASAPGPIPCMPTQAACDRYYSFEATPSPQSVPSVQQPTPVTEYYPEFEDDAAFHSDEEIQKVGQFIVVDPL